jgi:U2 small nuclear ribonucleoprotein B''
MAAAPPPTTTPHPTLYISNIDWSIKKPLLKRALYALFTRHGKVVDVIVLRGPSKSSRPLRGQAWVIFDGVSAATAALAEQNFMFFGRQLKVEYAREVSDRIARRDGKNKKRGKSSVDEGDKKIKLEHNSNSNTRSQGVESSSSLSGPQPSTVPTSTLLTSNIPPECNEMMLSMLFKQYSGFKKVDKGDGGVYTVSFESERDATAALGGLNGFKLNASSVLDLRYGQ